MKLLSLEDAITETTHQSLLIVQTSSNVLMWAHFISIAFMLLFLGLSLTPYMFDISSLRNTPSPILQFAGSILSKQIISLVFFIVALIFAFTTKFIYTQTTLPHNWIMNITSSGIYVQLSPHFSSNINALGRTVLFVPQEQIKSSRKNTIKETIEKIAPGESNNATYTSNTKILEIQLKDTDINTLQKTLEQEKNAKDPNQFYWYNNAASLSNNGIIEIRWKSLTPTRDKVIEKLQTTD